MRGLNIVMVGVCGLLIVGIEYFAARGTSPYSVMKKIGAPLLAPRSVSRQPEALTPVKREATPRKRSANAPKGTLQTFEPPPEPPAILQPARAPVPGGHPAPSDIDRGTQRSALLARYPQRSLEASTLRGGNLVEFVVYRGRDHQMTTFVELESGAVTRVYTVLPRQSALR